MSVPMRLLSLIGGGDVIDRENSKELVVGGERMLWLEGGLRLKVPKNVAWFWA